MSATMIHLGGEAGKMFRRDISLHLDTKTPAEAIRALCSILPGFKKYLSEAHKRGIEFAVFRGKGRGENINRAQLEEPAGQAIRIVPVLKGSKNGGIFQTILGIVLIVVGAYTSWAGGGALVSVGIGMVAGGVTQLLSPQPKANKNADSAGNQASYVFSGAVNTTAEGNPVPDCYGRMLAGSAVISAGVESDEYTPATAGVSTGTPNGNSKSTPYDIAV
jgi:predicted phage tail protein